MTISGFTIDHVEGKVESVDALTKQRFPKLNISLDGVNIDGPKIKVSYTFLADYTDGDTASAKSLGQLKLSGVIELSESKENAGVALKRWNEKKTLPNDIAEEIINALNFRCSATGTLVAYALGLIPPLVISTTRIQDQK